MRLFRFHLSVVSLLLLLTLFCGGCKLLAPIIIIIRGTDVAPEYDILLSGEIRVAVASRSMVANQFDGQTAARGIARELSSLLAENVKNKRLKVVESERIDDWLDNVNNDFESFLNIGQDKSINADIVIGLELEGFQVRDPNSPHLIQGKCRVRVKAWNCKTGKLEVTEVLEVVDPPNMPIAGGISTEGAFRPQFIRVVAQQIGILFYHHDPHKAKRIDADNLHMYRID